MCRSEARLYAMQFSSTLAALQKLLRIYTMIAFGTTSREFFLLSPAQACRNGSTYHLVGATQVIHGLTGVRSSPQNPKQQNCLSPICCHCLTSSLQGIG